MREMESPLTEYSPEMETFESEQFEWEGESESGVFNEAEEMELAAELLEVRDEQELEQFLGDLIKKVSGTIGRVVRSPIGQAIGGVLKGVVKKALPIAGGALGTFVGGPLGTSLGSGLASMAGSALGLEMEGLSQEDREFEAAKQFVRFAGEAVKNAATNPVAANPIAAAQAAAATAAQRHAPGLLQGTGAGTGHPAMGRGRTGRWIRRGRSIIIVNC